MISPVRFLGFLSLIASIQGVDRYGDGLKMLEELDDLAEQHASGLELLLADGTKKLYLEHDLEERRSLARSGQDTEEAQSEAVRRKCPVALREELAGLQYTLQDRWSECMNLSEKILDYERIGFTLYHDYLKWRPEICQAANDILICKELNIVSEIKCFYNQVSGTITKFQDIEKELAAVVEEVHNLVQKSIVDFKGCFSSVEDNLRRKQQNLLETRCPLK